MQGVNQKVKIKVKRLAPKQKMGYSYPLQKNTWYVALPITETNTGVPEVSSKSSTKSAVLSPTWSCLMSWDNGLEPAKQRNHIKNGSSGKFIDLNLFAYPCMVSRFVLLLERDEYTPHLDCESSGRNAQKRI